MRFKEKEKHIFAVSHLPGLLGTPNHKGQEALLDHASQEAKIIEECGFSGLLLENENDRPYTIKATPSQRTSMTDLAKSLRNLTTIDIGIEFLINDPIASLTVAKNTGCQFIRTDYWVDKMFRKEYGILEVDTDEFKKYREKIKALNILVFADIQVKYASMLEKKTLTKSTIQAFEAGADAVVVSSEKTGKIAPLRDLEEVKKAAGENKVFVGSGFSVKNAKEILEIADGALVGTSLMTAGKLDSRKATELAELIQSQ